jgi:hypothetical protein
MSHRYEFGPFLRHKHTIPLPNHRDAVLIEHMEYYWDNFSK